MLVNTAFFPGIFLSPNRVKTAWTVARPQQFVTGQTGLRIYCADRAKR